MKGVVSTAVAVSDSATPAVASTTSAEPAISAISMFSSVGSAFLLVLCLILFLGWLVKRSGLKKFTSDLIQVRSSYTLSAKERIVLIEVANQLLVVGVTSQQMILLHTVDPEMTRKLLNNEKEIQNAASTKARFSELFQSALKRGK